MEIITGTFEVQYDSKPTGAVIRVNDEQGRCILRICQIPVNAVYDDDGSIREFVDVVAKNS